MPIAHALVSFQPGAYGALAPTGHVAYVEKVDPGDPHRFEISEMNVPEGNHNVNYRWLVAPHAGMTFIYGRPGSPTPGSTTEPTQSGYTITGAPNGVDAHSGPGTTHAVVGHLDNDAPVSIDCQTRSDSVVNGSSIWDKLANGSFVPDYYVSTPNFNSFSPGLAQCRPASGSAFVMTSTGSAYSAPQAWSATPFAGSRATLACDVNGDRKSDLVAVNDNSVYVMLSTGSGFSAPLLWFSGAFYGSKATLCADVNGDGKADLIAVDDNATFVMLSNGSSFGAVQGWSGQAFYGTVGTFAGDVNGDGKSDLVALNYDPGN